MAEDQEPGLHTAGRPARAVQPGTMKPYRGPPMTLGSACSLPGPHPSAVSLPRLPTMYAIPVSHSHQLLCVPARAPGVFVCAPRTGLPPATVRTPTGLLGSVTSQISWAELA